jgi:hypothetical protein
VTASSRRIQARFDGLIAGRCPNFQHVG